MYAAILGARCTALSRWFAR